MRIKDAVSISLSGLILHKLRTFLTMLGIIFGVGAVIAMLSIGKGAEHEILMQIKKMGINTIKIKSAKLQKIQLRDAKRKYSYGLSLKDEKYLKESCTFINDISSNIKIEKNIKFKDYSPKCKILAVDSNYFSLVGINNYSGRLFKKTDEDELLNVCLLSSNLKKRIFHNINPIGKTFLIDGKRFEIIGYINEEIKSSSIMSNGNSKASNEDLIYVPKNIAFKKFIAKMDSINSEVDPTYNQLNEIIIKVKDPEQLHIAEKVIRKILDRKHKNVKDYEMDIPYNLLKQSQKTQKIFSIVMACIAGISLLVGGIGIMNIMLANITERTKEIGIRRALGASQKDILYQFLIEAIFISIIGGIIGIFFGIAIAEVVSLYTKWKIIYTASSIFFSFIISFIIGMFFGIWPATEASKLDPIIALRYE